MWVKITYSLWLVDYQNSWLVTINPLVVSALLSISENVNIEKKLNFEESGANPDQRVDSKQQITSAIFIKSSTLSMKMQKYMDFFLLF